MCRPRTLPPPFVLSIAIAIFSPCLSVVIFIIARESGRKKTFHSFVRKRWSEVVLPVLSQDTFHVFEKAGLLNNHNTAYYAVDIVAGPVTWKHSAYLLAQIALSWRKSGAENKETHQKPLSFSFSLFLVDQCRTAFLHIWRIGTASGVIDSRRFSRRKIWKFNARDVKL